MLPKRYLCERTDSNENSEVTVKRPSIHTNGNKALRCVHSSTGHTVHSDLDMGCVNFVLVILQ